MYADPSALAEKARAALATELKRRARRIFNLATIGFRQTLGNDRDLNWLFLRLLIEVNSLNNELTKLAKGP